MICFKVVVFVCLFCSVVTMPEKLSVYTTLVGLLNARNYNCGGEVCKSFVKYQQYQIQT